MKFETNESGQLLARAETVQDIAILLGIRNGMKKVDEGESERLHIRAVSYPMKRDCSHVGDVKRDCPIEGCTERGFRGKIGLAIHIKRLHGISKYFKTPQEDGTFIFCGYCRRPFKNRMSLGAHRKGCKLRDKAITKYREDHGKVLPSEYTGFPVEVPAGS